MTDACFAFLWAYSLRAAWTGGVIKGYLAAKGEPIEWPRFCYAVAFWPVTLWVGSRKP